MTAFQLVVFCCCWYSVACVCMVSESNAVHLHLGQIPADISGLSMIVKNTTQDFILYLGIHPLSTEARENDWWDGYSAHRGTQECPLYPFQTDTHTHTHTDMRVINLRLFQPQLPIRRTIGLMLLPESFTISVVCAGLEHTWMCLHVLTYIRQMWWPNQERYKSWLVMLGFNQDTSVLKTVFSVFTPQASL